MKISLNRGNINWSDIAEKHILFEGESHLLTLEQVQREIKSVLDNAVERGVTHIAIDTRFEGELAVSLCTAVETVINLLWTYPSKTLVACEIWANGAFTYEEYMKAIIKRW